MEALVTGGAAEEDENGNITMTMAIGDEDEEDDDEDDDEELEDGEDEAAEQDEEQTEATTLPDPPTTTVTDAAPAPPHTEYRTITMTRERFIRMILRSNGLAFGDDDDDDDEGGLNQPRYPQRPRQAREFKPHPPKTFQPQPAGTTLMESGSFGINDHADGLSRRPKSESQDGPVRRRKKVATRIMQRELGLGSPGKERSYNRLVSQELLPSSQADTIINYDDRCYSGQFSEDGNFYFTCSQDFRVRMYDTSNPYSWRHYKTVRYDHGAWTITDASLSPDNKYLAYSTMANIVALANTDPDTDAEPYYLDFADMHGGRAQSRYHGRGGFAVSSGWEDTFTALQLTSNLRYSRFVSPAMALKL